MQIYGTSQVHGAQQVSAPHAARIDSTRQASPAAVPTDSVDISPAGRLLEMAAQLPEIRTDRVNQLRAEIAGGAYESSAKLDTAIERLLDEIA